MTDSVPSVSLGEATRVWVRVATQSFGGPAGQIGVIHRIVVDEKRWLSEDRFLHALGYCMLLPGPEAQQLATYVGWLLNGVRGGLIAGSLFVLPGFLAILGLSILYTSYRDVGFVAAVFYGLKPAVLAIVIEALIRLKRRAAGGSVGTAIGAAAFLGIFFLGAPFPLIILAAALVGVARGSMRRRSNTAVTAAIPAPGRSVPGARRHAAVNFAKTVTVWLAIWLVPVAALVAWVGRDHVLAREALFFSKAALVTFGGAYAVLAYIAQQAVEVFGWLEPHEMIDGLGLAETTPGPLIMVVQFVAFLGAFRQAPGWDPILAGILGSIVVTWVTFIPSFLFIFAGAPFVESLRGFRALEAPLASIMAAIVGVVLNLVVWFALHTIFADVTTARAGPVRLLVPQAHSFDLGALVIALVALVAVFRYRATMFTVLAGSVLLGLVWRLLPSA